MARPMLRINTFFQNINKPIIEPISKMFIVAGLVVGINRLPLIATTKTFWTVLMLCYSIFLNLLFMYFTQPQLSSSYMAWTSYLIADCLQYFICTILGFMLHKRLLNFYVNLNKLDAAVGINAKKFGIRESVYNFLQLLVTTVLSIAMYFLTGDMLKNYDHLIHVIHIKLMSCFELHYCGHLLSLLIPRLKVVNACIQVSYPSNKNRNQLNTQSEHQLQTEGTSTKFDMIILMDFYNKIIIVFDCLNEAVKWQMLTHLISTFTITVCLLYHIVKCIIWCNADRQAILLVSISGMSIQFLPLLVPCVFADRVQKEVRLIKDYLAYKLYDNTLDKPSRSTARSLLGLIETRNLSFSVFNMFDIDISLPVKFVAVLLTYLIILLQFDKVISAD